MPTSAQSSCAGDSSTSAFGRSPADNTSFCPPITLFFSHDDGRHRFVFCEYRDPSFLSAAFRGAIDESGSCTAIVGLADDSRIGLSDPDPHSKLFIKINGDALFHNGFPDFGDRLRYARDGLYLTSKKLGYNDIGARLIADEMYSKEIAKVACPAAIPATCQEMKLCFVCRCPGTIEGGLAQISVLVTRVLSSLFAARGLPTIEIYSQLYLRITAAPPEEAAASTSAVAWIGTVTVYTAYGIRLYGKPVPSRIAFWDASYGYGYVVRPVAVYGTVPIPTCMQTRWMTRLAEVKNFEKDTSEKNLRAAHFDRFGSDFASE
ncbi:hypothetical protein B0H11DRAFT_1901404 [Mycena galericulata]|nr:hypothetical protein B0H11DRAFT_1931222 [Mycena galericulata]KAJ7509257.1 hypothetical protein B0H11DRAFT_1901387 [Mycena galericulata]KAJ7509278.1 hypothetical protein B0H11DRAFT_1901404 [Mycena galericulata]